MATAGGGVAGDPYIPIYYIIYYIHYNNCKSSIRVVRIRVYEPTFFVRFLQGL